MRAVVLGLIVFLIVLLVRLPARWITALLPAAVHCDVASGTVWNGACDGLSLSDGKSAPLVMQQVRWIVHPSGLLRGRLAADLDATSDWGQVQAAATLGPGSHLTISSLTASGTVDRRLLSVLPRGWQGAFEAREVALELRQRRLLSMRGMATVRGFHDDQGRNYGDFQMRLAPDADSPAAGDLRNLGGQTVVDAKIRVAQDLKWTLEGSVNGQALSASGNF